MVQLTKKSKWSKTKRTSPALPKTISDFSNDAVLAVEESRKLTDTKYKQIAKEATKYASLFTLPTYFYDDANRGKTVNNGTLTLLDYGEEFIGITCAHVIDGYISEISVGKKSIFQIGNLVLDPCRFLIDKNTNLDLATLKFNKKYLTKMKGGGNKEIGSCFIPRIYQGEISKGDFVLFAGLPGDWRKEIKPNHLQFSTFGTSCYPVESSHNGKFTCQLEDINKLLQCTHIDQKSLVNSKILTHLGGMSGAPIFKIMLSEAKINYFEFCGVIYEGKIMDNTSLIYARLAKLINADGTINDDFYSY